MYGPEIGKAAKKLDDQVLGGAVQFETFISVWVVKKHG
jgi:hypothetical protein